MAQFESLFNKIIISGLVIFCLIFFIATIQTDNDAAEKFLDDPVINSTYGSLASDLGTLGEESQTQKTLFESENPTAGFGTILLFSIVSAGKVFNGMIIGIFNTIIKLPVVFLGVDNTIISVLASLLILGIIIGLWAIYKLGG